MPGHAATDMQIMETSNVRFITEAFADSVSRVILALQSFPQAIQKARYILL